MISDLRLPGTAWRGTVVSPKALHPATMYTPMTNMVGDTFIIQAKKWLKERCAACFTDDNFNEITAPYMGDCQNYGPLLGPLNWAPYEAPYYNRDPNKDHNFGNPPHVKPMTRRALLEWVSGRAATLQRNSSCIPLPSVCIASRRPR